MSEKILDEKTLELMLKKRQNIYKKMTDDRSISKEKNKKFPIWGRDRFFGKEDRENYMEEKNKPKDLTSHYHCPSCGNKLRYMNVEECKNECRKDEKTGQEMSIHLECTGEDCYMKDGVYWTLHHPHPSNTIPRIEADERPRGDSYSISYIK